MITKNSLKLSLLTLVAVIFLAGCALPSMTPPAEYVATAVPTTTAPVPSTPLPATATAALQPLTITKDNVMQLAAVNKVPASNVQLLRWSADGSVLGLVTANVDANGNNIYSAILLDGKTLTTKTVFSPTNGRVSDISPDGRLVSVISDDFSSMNIYDLGDNGKNIISITPGYLLGGVTISPDGKTFAISSADTWQVVLCSLPSGSEIKTLTGFETAAPVYDAGFRGANGTILWHARATLTLQNADSGAMGATVSGEDFYLDYQLSPDGKLLAGTTDKTINGNMVNVVTLWNAANGNILRDIQLPDMASAIAFSPDASMIAASVGSNILVYDTATGNLLVTLSGHSGSARLMAFSPDGFSLASTGEDNQLILWQVVK
jgi:WD40 repeat protein